MAAPTNLLELAQQRLATWNAEKTSAQAAMAAAQTALTAGLAALQDATDDFAGENAAILDLRASLAVIATPADAEPLLAELETATIALRAASAAMLVQQELVDSARATLDAARERAQRADAGVVSVQATVTVEDAARTKREAAKTAIALPPLSTLPARATTLQGSQTFDDAQTRIDTDFPQALRDRSSARAGFAIDDADRAQTRRGDVEALVAAYYTASGNAADKLAAPAGALVRAEQALFDHVSRAVSRCDAAEAALTRIGGTKNPPLSAEEHAAIDDAVALPSRTTAADNEDTRDVAADAADAAQAKYDLEYTQLFAEDGAEGVATALADATSDLAKAKDDLDDASEALTQANTDFDNAMRDALRSWRAAVPDSAWRDLADFDAASRTLDELAANPAALGTAVTNAEAALLAASLAADEEEQRLRTYAQALDTTGAAAESLAGLLERARFSALRGDA